MTYAHRNWKIILQLKNVKCRIKCQNMKFVYYIKPYYLCSVKQNDTEIINRQ